VTWLGAVVLVVLALRSRSLPLRRQVVLLWTAAGAPVLLVMLALLADALLGARPALAVGLEPTVAAGAVAVVAVVLAVVVAVVAGLEPSGRRRARLRRLGDRVELVAVLALLPLLLGVF